MVAASVARGSPPWAASSRATTLSTSVRCSSVILPRSTSRSASGSVGSATQSAHVSARLSASTAPALETQERRRGDHARCPRQPRLSIDFAESVHRSQPMPATIEGKPGNAANRMCRRHCIRGAPPGYPLHHNGNAGTFSAAIVRVYPSCCVLRSEHRESRKALPMPSHDRTARILPVSSLIARWSPVTSDFGLIRAPLERVLAELQSWHNSIGIDYERTDITSSLAGRVRNRSCHFPTARCGACFWRRARIGSPVFRTEYRARTHFQRCLTWARRMGVLAMRVCSTPQDRAPSIPPPFGRSMRPIRSAARCRLVIDARSLR